MAPKSWPLNRAFLTGGLAPKSWPLNRAPKSWPLNRRAQLIISSEHEFARHKFFEKAQNTLDVYIHWEDAEGLPSVMEMRKTRLGWDKTVEYYNTKNGQSPEKIEAKIDELNAGDAFSWFSFPGGHAWNGVARRMSFAWFDRWLGRTMY